MLKSALEPNLIFARQHLKRLTGEDNPVVTFQVFSDSDKRRTDLAWHASGTLDELLPRLKKAQRAGCGVFVCVNQTDGQGRARGNVRAVRAAYLDLDGAPLPAAWPIDPSLVVETSPGRFGVFWVVEPSDDMNAWSDLQARLAAYYGGDPSVTDPGRVCRLAGFWHRKTDTPFQSRIVHADDPTDPLFVRWTLAELAANHPCDYRPPHSRADNGRSEEPQAGWDNEADIAWAERWLASDATPSIEGRHGDTNAFQVACVLRDRGISEGTALDLMLAHWNPRCEPPWNSDELAIKVANAYHYALGSAGSTSPASEFANEPIDSEWEVDAAAEARWRDTWPRRLVYEHKHGAKNARLFVQQRRARLIMSDDVLYALGAGGVWRETPEGDLRAEIRATDPTDVLDQHHVTRMVQAIYDLVHTKARPFEWVDRPGDAPEPRDCVLFDNGLLDLRTNTLLPLDGSYFATALPGVAYDELADCSNWHTWLTERLDPSFHPTLQEYFGYAMVPDTTAHRFLLQVGPPRSGKSTAKNVLERLVGPAHTSSKQLSDLGDKFGLEDVVDKRLLVIPDSKDVPGGRRGQALERLLALTGGDTVGIPRKFLTAVDRHLPTRLLVLGNRPPKWLDESGALAARQLVVRFDRSFEGSEDQGVENRLMTELPGIANWALDGLRRLRRNGYKFTVGELGKAEMVEVKRSASPAHRFAEECLEVTGNGRDLVSEDDIFTAYEAWAVFREGLARHEQRNKTDLMTDLVAALRGVRQTQRRGLPAPSGWSGKEYRPRVLSGVKSVIIPRRDVDL